MRQKHPKIINGVELTATEFRRQICEAINTYEGGASARDIARAWKDPQWEEPEKRQQLATFINNMRLSGLLRAVEDKRGYYTVSPNAGKHRGGVSIFEQDEEAILQSIRDRGGTCRLRDILHDVYDNMGKEDDFTYDMFMKDPNAVRIKAVIDKSTRIRQDFNKKGHYNLPMEEMRQRPHLGKVSIWLTRRVAHDFYEETRKAYGVEGPPRNLWYQMRDRQLQNVGFALEMLCNMKNVFYDDLLEIPAIADALFDFIEEDGRAVRDIKSRDRDEYQREKAAALENNQTIEPYEPLTPRVIGRRLLEDFADGLINTHYECPAELITALADYFDIDEVFFSVGVIAPKYHHGYRERPYHNRRTGDMVRQDDLRVKNQVNADRVANGLAPLPIKYDDYG